MTTEPSKKRAKTNENRRNDQEKVSSPLSNPMTMCENEIYRRCFEDAREGILIFLLSEENLILRRANSSAFRFLGCKREDPLLNQSKRVEKPTYPSESSSFRSKHEIPIDLETKMLSDSFWHAIFRVLDEQNSKFIDTEENSNQNGSKKKLKKNFFHRIGEKFYFLETKFRYFSTESGETGVMANMRGYKHDRAVRPDFEPMKLDVQEFTHGCAHKPEKIGEIIEYDWANEDVRAVEITEIASATFTGLPKTAYLNRWNKAELGFSGPELEWWGETLRKATGKKEPIQVEKELFIPPLGCSMTVIVTIWYLDTVDKKTLINFIEDENTEKRKDVTYRFFFHIEDATKKTDNMMDNAMRNLFNTNPASMAIMKIINDEKFQYKLVNRSFTEGKINPEEMIDKTTEESDLLSKDQVVELISEMRKANSTGEHSFSFQLGNKFFQGMCRAMGENEYSLMSSDISEIKRLEHELLDQKTALEQRVEEQTRELKDALEVKSRFLTTMSHEIRTPLSGVMGSLSHLAELENLEMESKEMLKIGQVCGEQLLLVINDVLDLSKIEANQLTLEEQELYLEEVLEESMDVVNVQAEKKGIDLVYNFNFPVDFAVHVDSCRLKQIIINLISNSVKFTQKGEITLSAELLNVNERSEATIKVSVRDTGVGIASEFHSRIFSPFSQADSSTTRKFGGTGLGLSISKKLVELFGGKMWFESQPGKGSEFFFTLLLKSSTNKNYGEKREALNNIYTHLSSMNSNQPHDVVIVESNAVQSNAFQKRLKELGFRVLAFESMKKVDFSQFSGDQIPLFIVRGSTEEEIEAARALVNNKAAKVVITNAGGRVVNDFMTMRSPFKRNQILMILDRIYFEGKFTKEAYGSKVITSKSTNLSGVKILLAEDNIMNQRIIKRMLSNMGIEVITADNGKQAIESIMKNEFDLVLMDCMMPEMGGIEATRYIRNSLPKHKQVFILALTADVFEENRRMCIGAGMDDVLLKPIDQQKLKVAIEKWLFLPI